MNTSLYNLMNMIESIEFDAHMSVFSGFNSFFRALTEDSTVSQIKKFVIKSSAHNEQIITRLMALLAENNDPQYAHPKDVAIAAYLYVLSSSKEFPQLVTEKVLRTPNLMWAKQLAETMLANQSVPTQS